MALSTLLFFLLTHSPSSSLSPPPPSSPQHPAPPPSPPLPPLRYSVPGLGQFTARSNGHIRCVFPDHTTVDCYCPALQRGGGPEGAGGVELGRGVWLGEEVCRVMLPNGRYQMVSTQHPSVLSRQENDLLPLSALLNLLCHCPSLSLPPSLPSLPLSPPSPPSLPLSLPPSPPFLSPSLPPSQVH